MRTHTHRHTLLVTLPIQGVGQDPGSSQYRTLVALVLFPNPKDCHKGWAGQVDTRQPWGEWQLGAMAVEMAAEVR